MTREKCFGTGITHYISINRLFVQLNYVPYKIAITIYKVICNLRNIFIFILKHFL